MEHVALIGTGTMGAPIGLNLARAGLAVTVWNRSPAKADALRGERIEVAENPADAARRAEAVAIIVTDDAAVESVLAKPEGVLAGLRPNALVLDMTTTSVAWKRRFAELVRDHSGRPVDAPVFGSRPQAEQGGLWPVVGAAIDDFRAAEEFLDPISDEIFHVGDIGAGTAVKLAGNLLLFAMMSGLAEAIALTEAHGIDPGRLVEVVSRTGFRSPYYEIKAQQMIEGDYAPRFTIDNAVKDLRLIAGAAADRGLRLPSTEATAALFAETAAAGRGSEDMAALFEILRA